MPFILRPRKRLPGEPEPSWQQQAAKQEAEEPHSVQGESSSNSGEQGSDSLDIGSSSSTQGEAQGGADDGRGDSERSAASDRGGPAAGSPHLLWAPAVQKKGLIRDAVSQTPIVKRPIRKPSS